MPEWRLQLILVESEFTSAKSGGNTHDGIVGDDLVGGLGRCSQNRAQDTKAGSHDEEDLPTKDIRKTPADEQESFPLAGLFFGERTSGGKGISRGYPRGICRVSKNSG
jgi:hypothetical protein